MRAVSFCVFCPSVECLNPSLREKPDASRRMPECLSHGTVCRTKTNKDATVPADQYCPTSAALALRPWGVSGHYLLQALLQGKVVGKPMGIWRLTILTSKTIEVATVERRTLCNCDWPILVNCFCQIRRVLTNTHPHGSSCNTAQCDDWVICSRALGREVLLAISFEFN